MRDEDDKLDKVYCNYCGVRLYPNNSVEEYDYCSNCGNNVTVLDFIRCKLKIIEVVL